MNHHDFWDGMRDDAEDVLVRHAYADWLDEQADPASEYYRLCGDALDIDPDSVSGELIAARMSAIERALLRPGWGPRLETALGGPVRWETEGGLIRLRVSPGLTDRLPKLAQELPLVGCGVVPQNLNSELGSEDDWAWLRSLTAHSWDLVLRTARLWPSVARRLRSLHVSPIHQTDPPEWRLPNLLPELEHLSCTFRRTVDAPSDMHELSRLRSLTVRTETASLSDVVALCPPEVRTLTVFLNGTQPQIGYRVGTGPTLANLDRLTLYAPPQGAALDVVGLLSAPLLQSVRSLALNVGACSIDGTLAEPPSSLERVQLVLSGSGFPMRSFVRTWGPHLRSLSISTSSMSRVQPRIWRLLLSSESLRELHLDAPVDIAFVRELIASDLSKRLESLALSHVDAECVSAMASAAWPQLRRLRLTVDNTERVKDALQPLVRSPMWRRLEVAHLRPGRYDVRLPGDFVARISDRLRVLSVHESMLTHTGRRKLDQANLAARIDSFVCIPSGYHDD